MDICLDNSACDRACIFVDEGNSCLSCLFLPTAVRSLFVFCIAPKSEPCQPGAANFGKCARSKKLACGRGSMHSATASPTVSLPERDIRPNPKVETPAPTQDVYSKPVLSQPPLPTGPPPPRPVATAEQSALPAQYAHVGWQDAPLWVQNGDIPPISTLLLREADAWRAVLSLHTTVVTAAHQTARSNDSNNSAYLEESQLNTNSREAAYCCALSSLASQCDALFSEIMKIRALRKTRRSVEVDCVNELMRSHCNEVLAIGQTLASNGALSVSSATAELRVAIQAQRNQVSQLKVFLETLHTASTLALPSTSKLVVGLRVGTQVRNTVDLDDVLKEIYSTSRELTDTSLAEALSKMFVDDDSTNTTVVGQQKRQFARRSGDRDTVDSKGV